MTKKLSASIFLAGFLLIALFSVSSQWQLWAQEPELRKSNLLPSAPLTGETQAQTAANAQDVAAPYPLYGSGDFFLPPYLSDNDRMGYNKTSDHNTAPLKPGWYNDWGTHDNPAHPGDAEFGQTIYFSISGVSRCHAATLRSQISANITDAALISRVQANPGAMWMIGNEPDSYYNGSPIAAALYAELYHHYYTLIKNADPTAKIAIGNVVQPSPKRMEYLDKVLAHYQAAYTESLQTDLWGVHLYRLNETPCDAGWGAAIPPDTSGYGWNVNFSASDILDLAKIEQSLRDFRQWMYDRGYGNVPLVVTEYGVLPPPSYSGFSDAVAAQFLEDSFNMLLTATDPTTGLPADGHRLVQAWAWFSTDHNPPPGYFKYGGDLFSSGGNLTVIGQRFQQMTTAHYTPYVDLQPVPPATLITSSTSISVTAYIQNRGNISAADVAVTASIVDPASGLTYSRRIFNVGTIERRYAGTLPQVTNVWEFTFTNSPTVTVPYSINVSILSSDANAANNVLSQRVTWWKMDNVIDLAVTDLSLSAPANFLYQQPVFQLVTATVKNVGATESPDTHFQFLLAQDGASAVELTPLLLLPAMQTGERQTFTTTFSITRPGNYQLFAILPETIGDIEIVDNNLLTRTISAVDPTQVSLRKTAPARVAAGSSIVYTLSVETPVTLSNVLITDTIPPGTTYQQGGYKAGNMVQWSAANLLPGATVFTFSVMADEVAVNNDYGLLVNNQTRIAGQNAVATLVEGNIYPLDIEKNAPGVTLARAPLTYTLTVANRSPITLTNFLITDTIPAGASYITGGVKIGNVVSWTLAALPPGRQAQVGFVVTTSTPITNSNYRVSAEGGALSAAGPEITTVIGAETPIDPAQGGSVVITNALNAEVTQRLTIEIPSKAVSKALTLAYASVPPPDFWLAAPVLGFTDLVFHLQAFDGITALPNLSLLWPMTVTLHYTNTDIGNESRLGLYYFDQSQQQWTPASTTCSGSGSLQLPPNPEKKIIQATACQLGEFALLQELYPMYMPLIFRD